MFTDRGGRWRAILAEPDQHGCVCALVNTRVNLPGAKAVQSLAAHEAGVLSAPTTTYVRARTLARRRLPAPGP